MHHPAQVTAVTAVTAALALVATTLCASNARAQYVPAQYAPAPQPTYAQPSPYYAPVVAQPPALPARFAFVDGQPVPPGYHLESSPRRGMIIGGAVTFGSLYVISVIAADARGSDGTTNENLKPLYIPVLGPFLASSKVQSGTGVLILDGIGQAAGLAMVIAGVAFPKTEIVRNDVAEVHLVPMASSDRAGLSLLGTF
jgi:hypothetical protein